MHIESGRRYVGLTKHTMLHRWNQHCAQAKSSKDGRWHFPNAIRKYGKGAFSHEILEVCHDLDVANLAEECWIELLDTRDPLKGFNLAKGGAHGVPSGPRKNPWDDPEFRLKAIQNSQLTWSDPSRRAAASLASKEVWTRPGFRESIEIALKGIPLKPEHRVKLSAAGMGKVTPQAVRAKISASQAGRIRDHGSIKKSAASRIGIVFTPEHRANIGAAQVGKKHSPEHIAKIVASLKGRPPATHCRAGHPLDDAYLIGGRRFCRVCQSARSMKYWEKKKARTVLSADSRPII